MPIALSAPSWLCPTETMRAVLHSIEPAAESTNPDARVLHGTVRVFDSAKFAIETWEWEAAGYPASSAYRWEPIILMQKRESREAFANEQLKKIDPHDTSIPLPAQAAAFLLSCLANFASAEPDTLQRNFDSQFPGGLSAIKRGIYEHYKGRLYFAEGSAIPAGQEHLPPYARETLVVYRPLYGDYGLRTRPLAEFIEEVEMPDGRKRPRFKRKVSV